MAPIRPAAGVVGCALPPTRSASSAYPLLANIQMEIPDDGNNWKEILSKHNLGTAESRGYDEDDFGAEGNFGFPLKLAAMAPNY